MQLSRIPTKRDWIIPFIIAGASMVMSAYATYTHNDRDLSNRVTALESHRQDDAQKLDHIQSQVDKLVDWALGK